MDPGAGPGIQGQPLADGVDGGADGVAEGGDLVDEGDAGGQEGVAGVLDQLGAGDVGDQAGGVDAGVHRLDHGGGGPVVGVNPDDDAVGGLPVGHGPALPEELGIGDVAETGSGELARREAASGAGRHGAFHDHHRLWRRVWQRVWRLPGLDPGQGGGDLPEVGAAAGGGGRAHGDEGNGAQVLVHPVGMPETEPALPHGIGQLLRQPRFVKGCDARAQRVEPARIDVDAQHPVAGRGQPGGGDGSHVSQPDYGNLQPAPRSAPRWRRGDRARRPGPGREYILTSPGSLTSIPAMPAENKSTFQRNREPAQRLGPGPGSALGERSERTLSEQSLSEQSLTTPAAATAGQWTARGGRIGGGAGRWHGA